ncbi:hypothetical protein KX729_29840 [Rhizobium sp. XQZ8]|uniref:hypothetical protein n=1 Tax=Rhizobium populisoli TaxID=2859785 RepID=UPI001CA4FE17|nr:hypothetical protein [Rhizobium populisoli]MBW6425610.1 hypothetical protein [Rhizobium populisoli]
MKKLFADSGTMAYFDTFVPNRHSISGAGVDAIRSADIARGRRRRAAPSSATGRTAVTATVTATIAAAITATIAAAVTATITAAIAATVTILSGRADRRQPNHGSGSSGRYEFKDKLSSGIHGNLYTKTLQTTLRVLRCVGSPSNEAATRTRICRLSD